MRVFSPAIHVYSVSSLTPDFLSQNGIDSLLLDVDCTLKRYVCTELEPASEVWLDQMRRCGINLCLVSNGKPGRIGQFARSLDLPFCAMAMKPLPSGLKRAIREQNWDKGRTAMVGDQIFADIMAANLAGIVSILVDPIHPEEEPWFTKLKRPFERFFRGKAQL